MADIINVMERYNKIISDLKKEGLYVNADLKFNEGDGYETIELIIKADNLPR